jgi:hypothetical protein
MVPPTPQPLMGYSNARSAGYNRLAKHQGRNAFGFAYRGLTLIADDKALALRYRAIDSGHARDTSSDTEHP